MPSAHYISSTYIKLLVQANKHLAMPLERALGVPLKILYRNPFIDSDNIECLIKLFDQHGLDSWVLRHGSQLGVSSHGPLGFAVLTAPNLERAIEVAANYSIVRLSYYDCQIKHINNRTQFIFKTQDASTMTNRWMVESGIYVVKQLIETIVAHPLGNNAIINFACPEPEYKEELELFYGLNCHFNQAQNYLSIPRSWGQIASPLSDPATFKSNLRKCQELKQELIGHHDIIDFTRSILRDYFKQQDKTAQSITSLPSLSVLAEKSHMTPRTFSRHLSKHNYSYRKLILEIRQELAQDLLQNTHLNIANIASQLGYVEPANFIRAFKTWHDFTPSQWRGQNHT